MRCPGLQPTHVHADLRPANHPPSTHVLLLYRAFLAVVCVRHADAAAHNAAPCVRTVVALVTHAHQDGGPHEGVADGALAVACGPGARAPWEKEKEEEQRSDSGGGKGPPAWCRAGAPLRGLKRGTTTITTEASLTLLAQAANRDAWLLAAHDQVGMMPGHGACLLCDS